MCESEHIFFVGAVNWIEMCHNNKDAMYEHTLCGHFIAYCLLTGKNNQLSSKYSLATNFRPSLAILLSCFPLLA